MLFYFFLEFSDCCVIQFIEGGIEQDSENSGDEEIVDEGCLPTDIDDTVVYNLNSLHLVCYFVVKGLLSHHN